MKRSTPLMITAIATGVGAVLVASLSVPAAFADTAEPTSPTLTITDSEDGYTVSVDSTGLGDGGSHDGGEDYTDWLEITPSNGGGDDTAPVTVE